MSNNIPWDIIIRTFKQESSAEDQEKLAAWLAGSSHAEVFADLQTLWNTIQKEGETYESNADFLWQKMEARMNKKKPKEIHFSLNKFRWISAVASVCLVLILSFSGYIAKQWYETNTIAQSYTSLSGKSKVVLPDGSEVWLNAESSLEYKTTAWGKERAVHLNGEAFFDVKKDAERPFIVKSQGFAVKVYGTTFNVEAREKASKMNVSLISGSVAVSSANEAKMIVPGEVATCTKNSGIITVEKADVDFAAMWAKESVRFERKSIKELSKYLSKWYGVKIILDPSIPENQAYTFTIRHEPFEEILRLMARTNPIQYSFDEKNVVRIERKTNRK